MVEQDGHEVLLRALRGCPFSADFEKLAAEFQFILLRLPGQDADEGPAREGFGMPA